MDELHGYYLEDLSEGMSQVFSKTVTEADIMAFAGISGDMNPVHMNKDYAEKSRFKQRIAHGMLSASFISAVLGTRLPGPGCIYLSQSLNFLAPVKIGDTVVARATVRKIDPDKRRIVLETVCSVEGEPVVRGEAVLMVERRPQLQAAQ